MCESKIINNDHLEPVFFQLLPELEKAGINYWVYGGVSIAAYGGKFHRKNSDVDVFIEKSDFDSARTILERISRKYHYRFGVKTKTHKTDRPKINVKIGETGLSVIPCYRKDNSILFRYDEGTQVYDRQILNRVKKKISLYEFFTADETFIQAMFIEYIKAQPGRVKRENLKKDARVVLSENQRRELGFTD